MICRCGADQARRQVRHVRIPFRRHRVDPDRSQRRFPDADAAAVAARCPQVSGV